MRNSAFFRACQKAPAIFLALLCLALAFVSWGHWVEYFGDAGFNLYTSWQVAEGKLPYRDLYYLHGPLAPLLEGLWMKVLGVSARTVVFVHLAFIWGIALAMFSVFSVFFGRIAACWACIYFLVGFALGQSDFTQNFNFVYPYKPEVLYGTFFSWLAFAVGSRRLASQSVWTSAFALGACWGFSLMLSLENFAALSCGLGLVLGLYLRERRPFPYLAAILGAFLPILIVASIFALRWSFRQTWYSVFGMFTYAYESRTLLARYGKVLLSRGDTSEYDISLLTAAFLWIAGAGGLIYLFGPRLGKRAAQIIVFLVPAFLFGSLFFLPLGYSWWALYPKAWLIFLIALLVFSWNRYRRAPPRKKSSLRWELGFLVYALVLFGKMFISPSTQYYGFFLGMPAAIASFAFVYGPLPALFRSWGRNGFFLRRLALGTLVALIFTHLMVTRHYSLSATHTVGEGGDRMFAVVWDEHQKAPLLLALVSRWVSMNTEPTDSLLCLPGCEIVNYLARRAQPATLKYSLFHAMAIGEAQLLRDIRQQPPDYVVVGKDITGQKQLRFQLMYGIGSSIVNWIQDNYEIVQKFGDSPYLNQGLGYLVYRKKAAP